MILLSGKPGESECAQSFNYVAPGQYLWAALCLLGAVFFMFREKLFAGA